MPLYQYRCIECQLDEERVAGIDDRTVTCDQCGAIMTRTTAENDVYRAYVKKDEEKTG